jgi:DNA-directed RNA polymerase sigma subunit (sigma70/sigma32)
MLSLLPPQQREASDPPALVLTDKATLLNVADPWHRSQLAAEQLRHLESQINVVQRIRREAVGELVNKHRAPLAAVASHLGLTKTRIGQLAKAALRALDGGDAR